MIETDPLERGDRMKWLKVGAVVIGGIVVFFVVNSVIHLLFGVLSAIAFVALVAGGIYGVTKLVKGSRRQELRQRPEYYEEQQSRYQAPPAAPRPSAPPVDVDDELARLKREMDR